MKMKIVGVFDKNTEDERLTLEATEKCNCGKYIIMDTTFDNEQTTNAWRHSLVLPDQELEAGDQVKIYTKKGINRFMRAKNDTCNLFFVYWGLEGSVWNDEGDKAYLYEISSVVEQNVN